MPLSLSPARTGSPGRRVARPFVARRFPRLRPGIASRCRERVIDAATIDEAGRRLSGACPPGTRVIHFGSHAPRSPRAASWPHNGNRPRPGTAVPAQAADDEEAARAMLPLESVADTIVGFHAQQSVEKSLKAILAAREGRVPVHPRHRRPHRPLRASRRTSADKLEGIDRLTPYAASLRYDDYQPSIVTRETALNCASAAVEWAQIQITSSEAPAADDARTSD